MDAQAALAFLDRFFSRAFDREAAIRELGDVREEKLDLLVLSPRDPSVRRARLELFEDDLVGVVLGFEEPIEILVADLAARFGMPREGVRLKPDEAVPYELAVSKADVEGVIVVKAAEAPASLDATSTLLAKGLIARRQFVV